jgi:hypothetical protein
VAGMERGLLHTADLPFTARLLIALIVCISYFQFLSVEDLFVSIDD